MIRYLADHNLRQAIVAGVFRREPGIDFITARQAGLEALSDPELLEWAANDNRIVVTHDVNTMTDFASQRVSRGEPMPGLFLIAATAPVLESIESLLLVAQASTAEEWEQKVTFLPIS